MKTLELLKNYGPVYFRPKGACNWTVRWVKPGIPVRPPNMRNLQKLVDKGLAWDAHNRPACFGFITADERIGKSWHYVVAYNRPKVPSDALRENTREMELIARNIAMQINNLSQLKMKDEAEIHPVSASFFRDCCIKALKSSNDAGALELYNRMQANPLQDNTLEGIYKEWNDPRSPIRTYHIDYPEREN